jgi:polyphosphate kinase
MSQEPTESERGVARSTSGNGQRKPVTEPLTRRIPISGPTPETEPSTPEAGRPIPESDSGAPAPTPTDGGGGFPIPWAVAPAEVPTDVEPSDSSLFLNRELSWVDFNWRVLDKALDERTPLIERIRFLSITASNLDEFFMKRVGGLKRQLGAGLMRLSIDGRTPAEQLALIREAVSRMNATMLETWRELREPLAEKGGIKVERYEALTEHERERLHELFQREIYPLLTPLAVDPGHPFPFLSNLSISLAVVLRHPERRTMHFARVKIPTSRSRWLGLETEGRFLPLEELVRAHVDELFRGMEVKSAHLFRVTRNADLRRAEEEADDLIQMISEELRERRFAPMVRLEVESQMPESVRALLLRELELETDDLYEVDGPLDLASLVELGEAAGPEHRFDPWEPLIPPQLLYERGAKDARPIFEVLQQQDLLVHHPYDSFAASVQRFVEEAANDPSVLAIKQTLYRTSDDSPVVRALVRAAESGKQIAVLVEVKARFDEAENIGWGRVLEEAGAHVTYGVTGLKTHAKVALVLRDEPDGIRAYTHVGTGNYHSGTARLYTDMGILTSRPDVGRDAVNLFHYLTGYAPEQEYTNLLIAPRDMRRTFTEHIEREIEHQRESGSGRIIAKMNGLDDGEMIEALYRASGEGVRIDLIVRGLCRLRPGVPGISENIRVRSIIGRFLEHDRIYWFENGDQPRVFLGSADWRRRNLDDRVEALVEVETKKLKKQLRRVLREALRDNQLSWELSADGSWVRCQPADGQKRRNYHRGMMRRARKRRMRFGAWDLPPRPTKG